MREVNASVMEKGAALKMTGGDRVWEGNQLLFANETILVADLEEMLSSFSEGVWKSAREEYNKD